MRARRSTSCRTCRRSQLNWDFSVNTSELADVWGYMPTALSWHTRELNLSRLNTSGVLEEVMPFFAMYGFSFACRPRPTFTVWVVIKLLGAAVAFRLYFSFGAAALAALEAQEAREVFLALADLHPPPIHHVRP